MRNSRSGAPSKLDPTSSRSALRFLSVNDTGAIVRRRRSGADGVERPAFGAAFELMLTAIAEAQPRAGHQVSHRPRNEDLTGSGEAHDAGADVPRKTADVVAAQLAFAD